MSLILCIETATQVCSVVLVRDGKILSYKESSKKNSHSEVITIFIDGLLNESNNNFSDLDAVAVSKGPGSYTGLRIGVSTAKGLCYALNIPLIAINTLQSMAFGMAESLKNNTSGQTASTLLCPMIDARRMEVYSAIYNINNKEVRETKAEIIDKYSFSNYFSQNKMIFFGDGASKCQDVITHPNAVFYENINPSAANMASLAKEKVLKRQFEDVAYFEPFYLKDFIAGVPKVKGLR
ncbi:MAG: tRNA (adenosine(37)-N6)-threonylcarbamoyltransferase complex dimerization subunit type 1 TsaB [Bacteroidales bacterium]|nr:tRNA (adenosine(37)-N6)-threonylcarbamoyltransferase complex dimerization subunit type 1 TsaB [Bacteroidales bacterium]